MNKRLFSRKSRGSFRERVADMHLDQRQIDKVVRLFHKIASAEEKGGNPGENDDVRFY